MTDIDFGLKTVKLRRREKLKSILQGTCKNGLYVNMQTSVNKFLEAVRKKEKISNFPNMTYSDLKTIAEKFIYLNTCPGIFKPWILFFIDLFQNQPPHKIILILSRIQMGPHEKHTLKWKEIARKLFKKVITTFRQNYYKFSRNLKGL